MVLLLVLAFVLLAVRALLVEPLAVANAAPEMGVSSEPALRFPRDLLDTVSLQADMVMYKSCQKVSSLRSRSRPMRINVERYYE